jgi:hypothetical protein
MEKEDKTDVNEDGNPDDNTDGKKEEEKTDAIEGFEKLMEKTLTSLNIKAETEVFTSIMNKLKEFNKKDQYKIIDNLQDEISQLQTADKKIAELMEEGGPLHFYKDEIQDKWNSTMEQLGELQGLILLDKVSGDATEAINGLLEAFSGKMSAVNKILGKKLTNTDKKKKKENKENKEDNANDLDQEIKTINEELKTKKEENNAISQLLTEEPITDEAKAKYIDRANKLLNTKQVGGSIESKVYNFEETKEKLKEKFKKNTELINELTCKKNNKTMIKTNKKCETKNKTSTNCDISGLLDKTNEACATEEKAAIENKCIMANSELLRVVNTACNPTSSTPPSTQPSTPPLNARSQDCNTTDLTNKANDACATEEKAEIDDKCTKANSELLHKTNETCVVEKKIALDNECTANIKGLLGNISKSCKSSAAISPSTECDISGLLNKTNDACSTEEKAEIDKECTKANSELLHKTNETCATEERTAIDDKCIKNNSELLRGVNAACNTTSSAAQPTAVPSAATSVPSSAHSQDCNTTDLTNNTNNACIAEKITVLDKECNKTNSGLLQKTNEACSTEERTATSNAELLEKINGSCVPSTTQPPVAASTSSTNCDTASLTGTVTEACNAEKMLALDNECTAINVGLLGKMNESCAQPAQPSTPSATPLTSNTNCDISGLTRTATEACNVEKRTTLDNECIASNAGLLGKTNESCSVERMKVTDEVCVTSNTGLLRKTNESCATEERTAMEAKCTKTNTELLQKANETCKQTPVAAKQPTPVSTTPSTPSSASAIPAATPVATTPSTPSSASAIPAATPATPAQATELTTAPSAIKNPLKISAKEEAEQIEELEKLIDTIIEEYDEKNQTYIAYIFKYLKGANNDKIPIISNINLVFSNHEDNIHIIKAESIKFNYLRIILMNTIVAATYKIQGQGLNMIMDTNEHMKSISKIYLMNFSAGVTITTEKIDTSLLYSIFAVLHKIISTYNNLRDIIYTDGEEMKGRHLEQLNTVVDCIKNIIINANNDITLLYFHKKLDESNMAVFIEENRIINKLCDDYINLINANETPLYRTKDAIYELDTRITGASLIVRYKLIIHSNVRNVLNDIPSSWDWKSIGKIRRLDKNMYCLLMNIIIALFIGDKNSDEMTYVDNLETLKEKYNNLDNLDTIYETQKSQIDNKWVADKILEIIKTLNEKLSQKPNRQDLNQQELNQQYPNRQYVLVHIKNIIIQSNSDIPFINSNSYNDIFLNKYNNIKEKIMKEINSTHNSDYRNCGIITWGLGMINKKITEDVLKEIFKEVTIGKNFNELFIWIFRENMINQYYCVILIYIILTSLFEVKNISDTDYINNSEGRIDDIKNRKIMNLGNIRDDKVLIKSILKLFSRLQAFYNSLALVEKENKTNPINYIITETLIAINNNIIYLNLSNQSLMNTFASYNDNRFADITKMIDETEEDTYSQQKYLFHSGRSGLVAYGLVIIKESSDIIEKTKSQITDIFDNIFKYNIINHDECVVLITVILASIFKVEGITETDYITIYAPITKEIALKYYKNIKIGNNSIRDLTFLSSILSLLTKLIELYIKKEETELIKKWIIQTIKKAINHITVLYSNSLIDNPDEITKRVASYNLITGIITKKVASTDIIKSLTQGFKQFNQLETNKTINKYLKYKIKYLNIKKKLVNII